MHPYEYLSSLQGTANSSFSDICEPIDLSMKRDRSKYNQVEYNSIACSISSDESDRLVIDCGSSAEENSPKRPRPSLNGCLESHSSLKKNNESKNSIGKMDNSERHALRCDRSPNRKKVIVNIKYANRDYYERKRNQKTITERTTKKTQRGSLSLKKSKRRKKRSSSHVSRDVENNFICDFNHCGFIAVRRYNIMRHIEAMHEPRFRVCCSQLYPTKTHFLNHRHYKHSDGVFDCHVIDCHRSFARKGNLNKHEESCHQLTFKEPISCSVCYAILPHPKESELVVRHHALLHSSSKPSEKP